MRKLVLVFMIAVMAGCTEPIDREIGSKYFEEVKKGLLSDPAYSKEKKLYIKDKIESLLPLADMMSSMGKASGRKVKNHPTFREEIEKLSIEYDSIIKSNRILKEEREKQDRILKEERDKKMAITLKNNKILKNFVEIIDASKVSKDKYNSVFSRKVRFNNPYKKTILQIAINEKSINKYGTVHFDNSIRITDNVCKDFKGIFEFSTEEKYNDLATFLWEEVPVRATKAMRDSLGESIANKKVMSEGIMKDLTVKTLWIEFKDGTKIAYKDF